MRVRRNGMSGSRGRICLPPASQKFQSSESMILLRPWPSFPYSVMTKMKMTTMMTTNNTKTTDELAATTSALGKDVEEIAGIIASLTRDLSPRRAIDVDVDDVSVDQEVVK